MSLYSSFHNYPNISFEKLPFSHRILEVLDVPWPWGGHVTHYNQAVPNPWMSIRNTEFVWISFTLIGTSWRGHSFINTIETLRMIMGFFFFSNLFEISVTSDIHPYGRKQRGTKEPLDESERGEWKSWLKTQHSENRDHGIQSHRLMANRWGNNRNSERLFSWAPKPLQVVAAAMQLKDACSLEEKLWPT